MSNDLEDESLDQFVLEMLEQRFSWMRERPSHAQARRLL
jgi:hypothetical protein